MPPRTIMGFVIRIKLSELRKDGGVCSSVFCVVAATLSLSLSLSLSTSWLSLAHNLATLKREQATVVFCTRSFIT